MINMETGTIIKMISNQYTIDTGNGEIIAKPRGKMRLNQSPVVGDVVQFEKVDDSYRIHSIEPRKNKLLRPSISNVDQALIVTSLKDPDFSDHLLNRLIFLVSLSHVKPVIVITKMDLIEDCKPYEDELKKYEKAGYPIFYSYPGYNEQALMELIDGKISVLCGQSGAGKSSLLNRLDPSFQLQTQEISKALGRGKHTTRHSELMHISGNTYIMDTPGFSSFEAEELNWELKQRLPETFLEFRPYLGQCRFVGCSHTREKGCAVLEAVRHGDIQKSRHQSYLRLYEELKPLKEWEQRK